ncbi:hypothetical protein JL722_7405 [Aureococcus anophagefferens]|nr:hypothetical protein JL722_7405 [Aureococcus anophagefferens]
MERRASQIAQMAAQRRASMASRQEAGMGGGGDGKISLVAPVITRKGESTDLLQAETKVLNFSTIRWLEKHHNHRVVKRAELDEGKVRQLREMFDHMDMDGSGDIEVDEVEQAMKFVRALNPQHPFDREKILQTFEYTDSDGSGTLSFDEFLTVMTSDDVGHTFFRLSDEQRADGDEKSFFQFATLYRREMLLNSITGGSKNMQRRPARRNSNLRPDSNGVHQTLRLRQRFNMFRELFDLQLLSDKLAEDAEDRRREENEVNRKRSSRVWSARTAVAAEALAKERLGGDVVLRPADRKGPGSGTWLPGAAEREKRGPTPRAVSKAARDAALETSDAAKEVRALLAGIEKSELKREKWPTLPTLLPVLVDPDGGPEDPSPPLSSRVSSRPSTRTSSRPTTRTSSRPTTRQKTPGREARLRAEAAEEAARDAARRRPAAPSGSASRTRDLPALLLRRPRPPPPDVELRPGSRPLTSGTASSKTSYDKLTRPRPGSRPQSRQDAAPRRPSTSKDSQRPSDAFGWFASGLKRFAGA